MLTAKPFDIPRYHCFEVVDLNEGKCFCGAPKAETSDQYPDKGYCSTCAAIREMFAVEIIGEIDMDSQKESTKMIILPLEQMRKHFLREVIYHAVDTHFIKYNAWINGYVEPYDHPSFKAYCLLEKVILTEKTLSQIILPKNGKMFDRSIRDSQRWYLEQVRDMIVADSIEMNLLMDGEAYTKLRRHESRKNKKD